MDESMTMICLSSFSLWSPADSTIFTIPPTLHFKPGTSAKCLSGQTGLLKTC